jgi:hypothetical protein
MALQLTNLTNTDLSVPLGNSTFTLAAQATQIVPGTVGNRATRQLQQGGKLLVTHVPDTSVGFGIAPAPVAASTTAPVAETSPLEVVESVKAAGKRKSDENVAPVE